MVRMVMMDNKKPRPLTFKEKKEYIKWQIELIEESETYVCHYLCIDFWKWLDSKGLVAYINSGYNLTLFPELLNAIRLVVKRNRGSFVLNHTLSSLEVDPVHYGLKKDCNIFRAKLLKNLRFK